MSWSEVGLSAVKTKGPTVFLHRLRNCFSCFICFVAKVLCFVAKVLNRCLDCFKAFLNRLLYLLRHLRCNVLEGLFEGFA